MPVNKVTELALCHVIKSNSILLIKTEEGISKSKWNAPGGEINQGEKPDKAAMRHVFQQTGIYVNKVVYHGFVRLFLSGGVEYSYKLHIYSTKLFSGDLKPNIQGEPKWFGTADIPYYEMWPDDKYWLNLVLQGKRFEADFFLDEKNERVVKYQIREKKPVTANAGRFIPIMIIIAVIGVAAFGVATSGILNFKPNQTQQPPGTSKSTTSILAGPQSSSTSTTSIATTTIQPAPSPVIIELDNIDITYNYSGPAQKGGVNCNVPSRATVIGYHRVINSTKFLINTTFIDGPCTETITNIYTTTPGFSVISVQPTLPLQLPASSQVYFDIRITSQNRTFSGPLSIVENYQ